MKRLGVVLAAALGLGSLGLGAVYWFGIVGYRGLGSFSDIDLTQAVTASDYALATVLTIFGVALLAGAGVIASSHRAAPSAG